MNRQRVKKLERELGGGVPCAECGYQAPSQEEYVQVEVDMNRRGGPPEPDQYCSTCGRCILRTVLVDFSGKHNVVKP